MIRLSAALSSVAVLSTVIAYQHRHHVLAAQVKQSTPQSIRSKSESLSSSSLSPFDAYDVVQVQVVNRHGDRTPRQELPKIPVVWPEGLGQLTSIGMKQCYDLGTWIKNTYGQVWNNVYLDQDIQL